MLVSDAAERTGRSVAIYPMTRLLAEIKETYDREGRPGRSYMDLFRRLASVDLLQLDDLGAEKRTEWVLEQLYSIVNERWQDQRAIVVTTNTTDMAALREELGARTVSRLTEICGEPIPIMGPDLRIPPMR
jgi:DNA replication protein DnaC